jgi:pilus assembly protein CpaC
MRRITGLIVACLSLAWPVWTHAQAVSQTDNEAKPAPETLVVPLGQTLLLSYPTVKRVSAGDGALLDVKVFEDTQEILLLGKKEGTTDLRVWTRDGHSRAFLVRVANAAPPPTAPGLQARSTVLIKAKLLEVKKSALKNIGVDWADVAAGPIFGSMNEYISNPYFRALPKNVDFLNGGVAIPSQIATGNNYLAFTTVIDSVINLMITNGDARLLAEPTLTCINGGQADFLAGGELPIPLRDTNGAIHVEFKQFGIILKIEPQANDAGLIRTKVGVEVSSVDKAISVLGIPGFATRKTNTEMNVQSGQPMVVAGLYSSEDAKTVSKVPLFGQIPILGELFKSRDFRNGQTELVVLVIPSVIGEGAPEIQQAVQQYDRLKERSDSDLHFKLLD